MSRKHTWLVVLVAVLLSWLLLSHHGGRARQGSSVEVVEPEAAAPVAATAASAPAPAPAAPAFEPVLTPELTPAPGTVARFALAKEDRRARHRPWASAKWGSGDGEIGVGFLAGSEEPYAPQGFTATADGESLLVLDSNNLRIVQYDRAGRVERTLSLGSLVMPADVAVAKDGTIIVADHAGLQTGGLVLIRPDGSLKELADIQPNDMMGLYSVGNDFWFDLGGPGSVRGGDTRGELSDETPGVYNYEDQELVPGLVAPDGETVITLGSEGLREGIGRGEFYVGAVRGEPPVHVFTHQLVWPQPLDGIMYAAADARGLIYVVIVDRASKHHVLVCLDAAGNPVGTADMGRSDYRVGTFLREYNVVETGGLVFQRLAKEGVSYEWYDCH